MSEKCPQCNGPLAHFKGFIPRIGNVCKKCYDKLVVEYEFLVPATEREQEDN